MDSHAVLRRQFLDRLCQALARHGVTIHRHPSLYPELPDAQLRLTADGDLGLFHMEGLQKALAERFGVHRRFIQVRMERYGLLHSGTKIH
jgi:hypothetical protein